MPERMSEDVPDRISERMLEIMPERMSEDMPDRMSEDVPGRMLEDVPDKMSEDMPARKGHGGDHSKQSNSWGWLCLPWYIGPGLYPGQDPFPAFSLGLVALSMV